VPSVPSVVKPWISSPDTADDEEDYKHIPELERSYLPIASIDTF